jgi:hypothetical protein
MFLVRLLAYFALGTAVAAQSALSAPQAAAPAQQPHAAEADQERSGADPLLDLPPLPNNTVSLVGGVVTKLDRVRDRMVVRAFGGQDMTVAFDIRTKFSSNGAPAEARDIRPGSRVYVDTMYDGSRIFAKSVRIETKPGQGDARGQVEAYDTRRGILTLRDQVSPLAVRLKVTPQTSVTVNHRSGSLADLRPGALVVVNFASQADVLSTAREIQVLATPGQTFTFAGPITFIDLRSRRLAINNRADSQIYDIALDSTPARFIRILRFGADAVITTVFDGKHYQARSIEISSPTTAQSENHD